VVIILNVGREGKIMKLVKLLIVLGLALFLGVGAVSPNQNVTAFAAEKQEQKTGIFLTQKELNNVKVELQKYGVNNKTIKKLVSKLANQEVLDSMLYDTDRAVSMKKIQTSTGYEVVHTFSDGSISVTGVEKLDKLTDGGFTTMGTGISGGSCTGGSGYKNCSNRKVYYSNPGVWTMSFKANYTYVQGGYDKITWAGNQSTWLIYGTIGDPSMRIIRSKETSFNKAEARYSAYLYIGGSYGTLTRSVSLIVGKDSAYARGNTYY
jgi:hypothetical protein